MAGSGAKARASSPRTGRYRQRSRPRPALRAAPTKAPRRADTPPCRAGAGPANRQNSSEKQLLQQRPHDPPWRPSSHPSIESEGARRIQSLTALSPTPLRPIALDVDYSTIDIDSGEGSWSAPAPAPAPAPTPPPP